MTRIKLKRRVLISVFTLIVIISGCDNKTKNQNNQNNLYGENWQISKDFFYENCSQCHVPRVKDDIFKLYISNTKELTNKEKLVKLQLVLTDSNHLNKNISINPLSKEELEKLILFIETPHRKRTIN